MRQRDRSEFQVEPAQPCESARRRRAKIRLRWCDVLVSSRLYGRSRWLHSFGQVADKGRDLRRED